MIDMDGRRAARFYDVVRPDIWPGLSRKGTAAMNTAEQDFHGRRLDRKEVMGWGLTGWSGCWGGWLGSVMSVERTVVFRRMGKGIEGDDPD